MIDQALIQRCKKDDPKAQTLLYEQIYRELIGVCWRYAGNKDLAVQYMNSGFVRILMNIGKYKSEVPFETWARRVMINNIINEYRKEQKHQKSLRDVDERVLNNYKEEQDLNDNETELLDRIQESIRRLPPMTAKVFNLYAMDGYKHHEISSLLKISEGTSMWHYSEAKRRIREMMNGLTK